MIEPDSDLDFLIRQCESEACRFRFPEALSAGEVIACPLCSGPTRIARGPFRGRQRRHRVASNGPAMEALLDNIRSSYNVGSIFRTADGAGVRHLHLCGISATPEHRRVAKTALGAQDSVNWSHYANGLEAANSLKCQGYRLWALEDGPTSNSLFEVMLNREDSPIVLVVGNERSGVDPDILDLCDQLLSIPMQGHKGSLNVVVAFGVAAYYLRYGNVWNSRGE